MNPSLPPVRRREYRRAIVLTLLAVGACQNLSTARAAEEADEPEEAVDPASLRNWVEFTLGGMIPDGDTAAARARTGLPKGVYGGVGSFHYETEVDETTLLQVDGRGIFDNHDYQFSLDVTREELGYLRAGLKQYRTYQDGSGGWFPADDIWYEGLFDDAMAVDRREVWFEGGLRLPDWPEVTVRYSRFEREGRKGSTSWGDATTSAGARKITPSFLDLDETRDSVALDARHTLNRTTLGLGLRYEHSRLDNSRNLRLFPGEAGGVDQHATQREETQSDLFNVHASGEHRFNDQVWLTLGYAFTDLDSDSSGYRVYGSGYDADLGNRLPNAFSFQQLQGEGALHQHVANLNLFWALAPQLDLIPKLRLEQQTRDASSVYGAPAAPLSPLDFGTSSDRGLLDVAGGLEFRYRGVTNVVFYAGGDWLTGRGDLAETWEDLSTGSTLVARSTDDERFWQKYRVGANWYPHRRVSLGAGYFYKLRENDFDHTRDNTPNLPAGNRYPAYLVAQQFALHDANARVTWRPLSNLTLVGRYDLQLGTIENQADGLAAVDAAELTSHRVSGSVSWVPLARLYVQARGSTITDRTESPVSDITDSIADSSNDYWTATGILGYALSNDVDLQGSYTYYRADNFSDLGLAGQPYGAGREEQWVMTTLTWQMNPRVRWTARYGYGTSEDELSGGNNDFDAHLLQASMQYRF